MININDFSIKRNLFKAYGITIDSVMHLPSLLLTSQKNNSTSFIMNAFPMLIISKELKNFENGNLATYRFIITSRNHYKVMNFFNKTMKWFTEEKHDDLYYFEESTNNLAMDMDIAIKLSNILKDTSFKSPQLMKVTPGLYAPNKDLDGNKSPAVILALNNESNYFILPDSAFNEIFQIIFHFSFQTEMSIMLSAYTRIINGDFETTERFGQPVLIPKQNNQPKQKAKTPFDI